MANSFNRQLDLFGGSEPWNGGDWIARDDRVRGGKSQSYLECSSRSEATFHGVLDIKTLGGAGFASQRTAEEDRLWNLSGYDGMLLAIELVDDKQYTFTLKDTLLPPNPNNGRERSTLSYEYDFTVPSEVGQWEVTTIFIAWDQFKATYRGRDQKDAPPLNIKNIKRLSLMMRSFFGNQEGPFSLKIKSISAVSRLSASAAAEAANDTLEFRFDLKDRSRNGDSKEQSPKRDRQGFFGRAVGMCVIL